MAPVYWQFESDNAHESLRSRAGLNRYVVLAIKTIIDARQLCSGVRKLVPFREFSAIQDFIIFELSKSDTICQGEIRMLQISLAGLRGIQLRASPQLK